MQNSGRRPLWVLSAALLLSAGIAEAKTVYVDAVNGNDAWDGLCEEWDGGTCGPKATIQAAINTSVDGDEIQAADGTYSGTGNRDVSFNHKAITLFSKNGPANCIVDGQNVDEPAFRFVTGEGLDTVLDGFTITNAYGC